LYDEIYQQKNRFYWQKLDIQLRNYANRTGLDYARDDDSMQHSCDEKSIIVNYFYHEEVRKSVKKM